MGLDTQYGSGGLCLLVYLESCLCVECYLILVCKVLKGIQVRKIINGFNIVEFQVLSVADCNL